MYGGDPAEYIDGGGEYNEDKDMVLLEVPHKQILNDFITEYGDPTKESEFFEGYYLKKDFTRKMLETERFDIDLNIHLKFYPTKINYNPDGGTLHPDTKFFLEYLEMYLLTEVEATKEGYVFQGWYTDPSLEPGYLITSITMVGEYNLYAKWVSA